MNDVITEQDREDAMSASHGECSVCCESGCFQPHSGITQCDCGETRWLEPWGGLYFHAGCLEFAMEETKKLDLAAALVGLAVEAAECGALAAKKGSNAGAHLTEGGGE